ncbi:MAG: hypothetical protein H6Q08_2276, partial [Acidobacteria bacterium]|nr:hypothetical protein [Acidobacteriota bacterium]
RMGLQARMTYDHPGEIFEEIRRVTPIYRDLVFGSQEPGAIWDLNLFQPPRVRSEYEPEAPTVVPSDTLMLDCLDARFTRWFAGLFLAGATAGKATGE